MTSFVTTKEAAEFYDVSPRTITKWAALGKIKTQGEGRRKRYKIARKKYKLNPQENIFVPSQKASEYYSVSPYTLRRWIKKGIIKAERTTGNQNRYFLDPQINKCKYLPQTLCSRSRDECEFCLEKTFASHHRAKFWSEKNIFHPTNILKSSAKFFWFDCNVCKHKFESQLSNITHGGNWCPFCANRKLCKKDCDFCLKKSFASHPKAQFWSEKNENIFPRNVFPSTRNLYWFDCNVCKHEFESTLGNITHCGNWCPVCKNKTERKLFEWLTQKYSPTIRPPYKIIKEFKPKWCKNQETKRKRRLPFDFLIKELNLIIELDGAQHFKQVSNWKDPTLTRERDIYKMNQAILHGYSVIRLLQEDVLRDKNNWEVNLTSSIRRYETPQIIYLCENNEYHEYPNRICI